MPSTEVAENNKILELHKKMVRFAHAAVLQASFGTKDRKEGMTAFVEKRKANWEHK